MKKIFIYTIALAAIMTMGSCAEDFLEQENTTNLNQETFFDSDDAVSAGTAPLYNYVWNSFNEKAYYGMGDGRANNITAQYSKYIYPYTNFTDGPLSEGLDDAWNALYSVVAQSNNTIYNISEKSTDAVSAEAKTRGIAEARFMRGTAYWYIASLWGGGIIYTNTAELVNNYANVQPNPRVDMMEFAIRDLEYAAAYLPERAPAAGRLTKYSAWGMLSRVYLHMAGLTTNGQYDGTNAQTDFNTGQRNTYYLELARKAAKKVIYESGASLLTNYGDLFSADLGKSNNNAESLFQLQWLTGSTTAIGWGCNQAIQAFFGWSSIVSETGWGGAVYCSWDLWKEYCQDPEEANCRRYYNVASYGNFYPDLNIKNGGYTYGVTEKVKDQGANVRKYVVGLYADNGYSQQQSSGINTYMLRLAEVYLNYAEAILGNNSTTSDAEAITYYNKVRERAGVPTKGSIGYKELRHERRVELAFEGLYWYDLLCRSYYYQQEVVNYLNSQNRNASYNVEGMSGSGSKFIIDPHDGYALGDTYEAPGPSVNTATKKNLILAFPNSEQGKNANLRPNAEGMLNTVPYAFGDREVSTESLYND